MGSRGALGLDQLSSQSVLVSLQRNQDLVQSVSRVLEDPAFLSALQDTLMSLSSSQSASVQQVWHKNVMSDMGLGPNKALI